MTGTLFSIKDSRLHGYGSPPSTPAQRLYPGAGRFPMERVMIAVDELPVSEIARLDGMDIFDLPSSMVKTTPSVPNAAVNPNDQADQAVDQADQVVDPAVNQAAGDV